MQYSNLTQSQTTQYEVKKFSKVMDNNSTDVASLKKDCKHLIGF